MTPSVIPLDGNVSLLLWRAMGTEVLEARQAFSHLASRLSFGIGHQKSKTLVDIYGKLNVTLVWCNARALLSRACNLV